MAQEAEKFNPKAGHVVSAVELTTDHEPIDAIADKDIAGWTTNKTEVPTFPIDIAKLTPEQRKKIVEDIQNLEKLDQMTADNRAIAEANETIEKRRTQIENVTETQVPLAAAAGGGMVPPTEPANDNTVESDEDKLKRMIAENNASTANRAPEIPPQTEVPPNHPAFENRDAESMLDTASRLGKNAAEYAKDKLGESMQYGILGKLEPMLERAGIRLLSAPRRMLLEGLYKWRSERAFRAKQDLDDAEDLVKEKEKDLAESDAKIKAFLADEKTKGWSIGSSSIKFEKERANAVKRIESAKTNRDAKKLRLEQLNGKKIGSENKHKDWARNVVSNINLHPKVIAANADYLAANKVKEDITNQLQQWEAARTKAGAKLAQLEAKLRGDVSYAQEEEITGHIDEIKKILEEGNKKHAEYVKKKNAADGRMQKINTYLGGWNNYSNELGRVGENNRYEDAGPAVKETVAADRVPAQSHAPQA